MSRHLHHHHHHQLLNPMLIDMMTVVLLLQHVVYTDAQHIYTHLDHGHRLSLSMSTVERIIPDFRL